jgi:ubiquinone/menaquinone biosynthesis C-methylase UbiE|tara:strand:- start:870 stop:1667 length:798 start_codon:yes stop_codon:yes gene_type:complete
MVINIDDKTKDFLGYKEKNTNLSIRINTHKKFSSFSLEDFMEEHLQIMHGNVILDIGCGNGNLFPLYSRKIGESGVIVGVDQSNELLIEGRKRDLPTPRVLLQWDMNNRFPFIEECFDSVVSSFAIYYVSNVVATVEDIKRMLKTSGKLLLIGPTHNNAKELYGFNKKVFGIGMDKNTTKRTSRLEKEFYPVIKEEFVNVSLGKIPSKLVFPDKAEFIKYYMATLLFEESVRKTGLKPHTKKLMDIDLDNVEISKEMVVLQGDKL